MEKENINIYCDESCHLQNDHISIMTLGAIHYPQEKIKTLSKEINRLKDVYNCRGELKWTKVSPKNSVFYHALIDLFVATPDLHFRSLIVHNKENLDHETYNKGDHDNFYYKMYFYLLRNILENKNEHCFNIYLDIKDTKSSDKTRGLKDILNLNFYDNQLTKVCIIQQIRSHESNLLQLCDYLLGLVTYANRAGMKSDIKHKLATFLSQKIDYDLTITNPPWENKFNLFHFTPQVKEKC